MLLRKESRSLASNSTWSFWDRGTDWSILGVFVLAENHDNHWSFFPGLNTFLLENEVTGLKRIVNKRRISIKPRNAKKIYFNIQQLLNGLYLLFCCRPVKHLWRLDSIICCLARV